MKRVLAVPVLGVVLVLAAWLGVGHASDAGGTAAARTFDVRVGDRIEVAGEPLGCRVARVRELGRSVALDCRRAGPLRGTYGTLITDRKAAVVEFTSRSTAKLVFVATHDGTPRKCSVRRP